MNNVKTSEVNTLEGGTLALSGEMTYRGKIVDVCFLCSPDDGDNVSIIITVPSCYFAKINITVDGITKEAQETKSDVWLAIYGFDSAYDALKEIEKAGFFYGVEKIMAAKKAAQQQ